MKETADKFIQAVKDGKIDPGKLADMSSAERNAFFEQIVGKNHATAVNSLFESKLLLKNQQRGMVTWAKQVSGIKPQARRDLIAKIERMQTVLDPVEKKQFLHDLTATRLGVDVTQEEAKNIADLSKKVSDLQALQRADKTFPSKEDRLNYGRAVEDLTDYVAELKQGADKLTLASIKDTLENRGPLAGGGNLLKKFTSKTAGNLKSLQASMDNSVLLRQGFKVLMTHPSIWSKNATQTFTTIAKEFGGKNVLREVNADIISRPNYDKYVRAGLAIKNPEEAFPEALGEKVPGLKRLYRASEAAFTGFQYKTRADVFDKYLSIAKKNGVDIEDKDELKALGSLVNSLTARGNLGRFESGAGVINNLFFSPRLLKSQIDTFLHPVTLKSAFARKQAAKNLLKIISGTAAVMAVANSVMPGSVELDPRSSDFGKIRIGDTRIDITGGMGSLAVLAARLYKQEIKSTGTGEVQKLNTGKFGAETSLDQVFNFISNKFSPAAQMARQLDTGKNFMSQPVSRAQTIEQGVMPISVQTFQELKNDPNGANVLLGMITDGLGLNTNTYSAKGNVSNSQTSWSTSTSKELSAFKQAVGQKKFNQSATQFDTQYNAWIDAVKKVPAYQKLSTNQKQSLVIQKQNQLKKQIFEANGFKYKKQKTSKNTALLNK